MNKELELKKSKFILNKHGLKEINNPSNGWLKCGDNIISEYMFANMLYTLKEFKEEDN